MTTCPTCSCPCRVVSDKEGTNYYEPTEEHVIHFLSEELRLKSSLVRYWEEMTHEIGTILSCHENETVVEAAKRWREAMEWYGDATNYDIHDEEGWYRTGGTLVERDAGQRARECVGEG